jgi:hypothetical protein
MSNSVRFQFKLSDLFRFLALSAVAAWLASLELYWLIPILMTGYFGYTGAAKSGYHFLLTLFGGLSFGVALLLTCGLTYLTFFHPFGRMFGTLGNIQILLTIIVWLVTLILFLQFRKLTRRPINLETAETQTERLQSR